MSSSDDTAALGPRRASPRDDPSSPAPAQTSLSPGARVGNYVLEGIIASGGCGAVYRAQHALLGRYVAIKVLHAHVAESKEMVSRFVREAQAVNTIGHPNIVDIFEFDSLPDGRPYHVMDLIDGQGLDVLVAREGARSPEEAFEILRPVCEAVKAAHAHGILHRDLKPSNVVVGGARGSRVVKLVDFGIAKLAKQDAREVSLTSVGSKIGTPISMSPEQIRQHDLDGRTDIYALGVILFFMLTGRYPYEAKELIDLELMHLSAPIPLPSAFVPGTATLDGILVRCLAKQPDDRFESVEELEEALADASRLGPAEVLGMRRCPAIGALLVIDSRGTEPLFTDVSALADVASIVDRTLAGFEEGDIAAVRSCGTLLVVRPLPDDDEAAERLAVSEFRDRVRALGFALAERAFPHPDLLVTLAVRLGEVIDRESSRGREVVGGTLLDVEAWRSRAPVPYVAERFEDTAVDA